MQIISIHLKNIKSHRDTELSFSAGINVLSGPNGAGKSTIFEAIGYALFGVDAKDFVSNAERFLAIGTKKGEISVTFQADDNETYRVSRTVGAAAKWLLAREVGGSFEVEDHARMEETEARIAGILGLANGRPLAEQFKLVIGPFQNDFLGPFIIRQPTKRQEAFDEILGIDAWRKTYKGTGSLLSAVQEKGKLLAVEVAGKQEQLAVLPDKTTELAAVRVNTALTQQLLTEQERHLAGIEAVLAQLEADEKAFTSLTNELQLLTNRITDGTVKIAEQRVRVDESRGAQTTVEQVRSGKEAYDRIENTLVDLRQKVLQRRTVEQEIAVLEKEVLRQSQLLKHEQDEVQKMARQLDTEQETIKAARLELQPSAELAARAATLPELQKERDNLAGQRALLDGRHESLLEGKEKLAKGVCPFFQEQCRNIAGTSARDIFTARFTELDRRKSDLDEVLAQTVARLKEAEAAAAELNTRTIRAQELDKQFSGLEMRRSKNDERSAGVVAISAQHGSAMQRAAGRSADLAAFAGLDDAIMQAEQERLRHQSAKESYSANLKSAEALDKHLQQLQTMEALLLTLSAGLADKQAELATWQEKFQPELLLKSRQDKENMLTAAATVRQQLVDLVRTAARLSAEIEQLNSIKISVDAKQAEIKTIEEKEKLVKFLRNQVFKNVSAQLSERFREEISLRADRIYRTIADSDEELYWGDNYQIILKDMKDGALRERSDDQLSGGQMMSAVVALRLALLQTIGARVAFFDEPTSNLDAARRENLAHAFRAIDVGREEVTEHWYDQLFLVSHDVAFTEITDKVIEL